MSAISNRLPGVVCAAGLISLPFVARHASEAIDTLFAAPTGGVFTVVLIGAIGLYFLPPIIALMRDVTGCCFLAFFNFLSGWTPAGTGNTEDTRP
jgi:hypothetical protein